LTANLKGLKGKTKAVKLRVNGLEERINSLELCMDQFSWRDCGSKINRRWMWGEARHHNLKHFLTKT